MRRSAQIQSVEPWCLLRQFRSNSKQSGEPSLNTKAANPCRTPTLTAAVLLWFENSRRATRLLQNTLGDILSEKNAIDHMRFGDLWEELETLSRPDASLALKQERRGTELPLDVMHIVAKHVPMRGCLLLMNCSTGLMHLLREEGKHRCSPACEHARTHARTEEARTHARKFCAQGHCGSISHSSWSSVGRHVRG